MTIRTGSTVTFVHKGMLEDGSVFDRSTPEEPVVYEAGRGLLLDGLEREIGEMSKGEKKTFTLKDHEAYGEYLEHMVKSLPKETVPSARLLKVGDVRWMLGEQGNKYPATVKEIQRTDIIFDLNHPLAGKNLTYEVEVLDIDESTALSDEELELEEAKRKHLQEGGALGAMGAGGDSGTVML